MQHNAASTLDDTYATLIAILHPSPPTVLEIDILPSSFPPHVLYEPPALALSKSLLVPLYLKARKTFFDHITSPTIHSSSDAAFLATAILLLFDPNHITAANFRKRHLQRFDCASDEPNTHDASRLAIAVQQELRFLESLLTSPLNRHTKSSTLWAQRLWVIQTFTYEAFGGDATVERIQGENSLRGLGFSWEEELRIVMKAAERHPRNYYAWQYARQIYRCVHPDSPGDKDKVHCDRMLSSGHIGAVHGWCLMHPRDISGWAFLIYFWEQMRKEDAGLLAERELEQAVFKTRTFVEKYQWKGQSIEWFLKAADVLAPQ